MREDECAEPEGGSLLRLMYVDTDVLHCCRVGCLWVGLAYEIVSVPERSCHQKFDKIDAVSLQFGVPTVNSESLSVNRTMVRQVSCGS